MTFNGLRSRATWVYTILRALDDEGVNTDRLLAAQNLSFEKLESNEVDIEGRQVAQLWQAAQKASKSNAFSLRVMDFLNDPIVNALIAAVETSQDLRHAVSILLRYYKLVSLDLYLTLELGDDAKIIISKSHRTQTLPPENVDVAFGLIFRCGSLLAKRKLYPSKIYLSRPKPESSEEYENYFGCPVAFSAPENAIIFPRVLLEEKVTSHNPSMNNYMERFLEEEMARLSKKNFDLQIRSAMNKLLGDSTLKLETVAKALNMSKRTLQRKLESENTSFQSLLNETRVNRAKIYLLEQQKTVKEVAHLLGFSEESSFARFFRKHAGTSPREYVKSKQDRPAKNSAL